MSPIPADRHPMLAVEDLDELNRNAHQINGAMDEIDRLKAAIDEYTREVDGLATLVNELTVHRYRICNRCLG